MSPTAFAEDMSALNSSASVAFSSPLRTLVEAGTMRVMARYMKKQVVVEAVQWFKPGDHPAVHCESPSDAHGYIDTPEGRLNVIPGDWIITGVAGENYPCKPDIFKKLYSPER